MRVPASPRVPPAPPLATGGPAKNQPPLIWVGGLLSAVTPDHLEIREESGSPVELQRLAEGATQFYRAARGAWRAVGSPPAAGERACVEGVMAGSSLLALRVFLGTDCGPAG